MKTRKVLKLQKWIKKEFPTKEDNGLHSTGHAMGSGFITIEFMDNNFGVRIILCIYSYDNENKKPVREGLNIGTYKSKRAVKKFLKSFKGD